MNGTPEVIDDGSDAYLSHRENFRRETASADLLDRVARRKAAQQAQQAPEQQLAVTASAASAQEEAAPEESTLATAGRVGAAVGSDVMRGATETGRAILGGARDAMQSTIDLAGELAGWLEKKAPIGGVKISRDGVSYISPNEMAAQKFAGNDVTKEPWLPDVRNPESVTGKIIENVAQFLTGFVGAGKVLKPLKAALGTSTTARIGGAMAQGAVADFTAFDAHEARLSDLVQSVPELQNPVTEYLASNPTDSEAEGRFKNALEGLGLGAVVDGLTLGVRTLRQSRIARRTQDEALKIAGSQTDEIQPTIKPEQLTTIGDAADDAPLVSIRKPDMATEKLGKALDVTEGMKSDDIASGSKKPAEMFINFARINAPEDVKQVMQDMADKFKPAIDGTRRGKQTFKQIELNAEQVNAWDTLMTRRSGTPLNAEESLAARQLWATSADKLQQVARDAATNPSEANLFMFRKMMATHQAIQSEVIAARTETARALSSWRIPAGGDAERFRDVANALDANGGTDLAREMAEKIAKLSSNGMVSELDEFVRASAYSKTRDAMMETWIMGLLSGPKTHIVNMMSNTSVLVMQMYERATAAQISRFLGTDGGIEAGEATAQLFGLTQGWKDALRYAKKAAITGESGMGAGKIELPRKGAISSEAFNISGDTLTGRAVDTIGNIVRLPGRALTTEDEFFKTIGYRMELNAQALRRATQEVNAGTIAPDGLKARITEIVNNPPEHIRMASVDQALYQTFNSAPGKVAQSLQKLTAHYPALKVLLPFVRTPANILRYTFERTPLAPLMQHVRADVAAGGARKDLAMARMATGSAIMLTSADMAMSGQISGGGPINAKERATLARTGWQPYSVKVGDRWYAYNRMDPLGSTLGMSADLVEVLVNTDKDDPNYEAEEAAVAVAAAIGANVMNKTYLSGLSDFFEAMADPRRKSESFAQRLAGSVIPTGVAEITRHKDPYMREASTMLEAIKRRTPGLSDELPKKRDLWGRPQPYQSGLGWAYDAFSPIYSKKENPEPIDTELLRLEAPITMPSKRMSFDGVIVDLERFPGTYSRFLELSGNESKDPAFNIGAKDMLNEIVSGRHPLSQVYNLRSDGPDGSKAEMIQDIMNRYRDQARRELLSEMPDLRAEVDKRAEQQRQLKMPVFN